MNNKPLVIGVSVAAVLLAIFIIWKTMFTGYDPPPPITTGSPGGKAMTAPAGDRPGTGGLSMPNTVPGGTPGGPSSPGGGMTLPTPPPSR